MALTVNNYNNYNSHANLNNGGGFWSKVTSKISTQHLSSSEKDGRTEIDTVIHKAMVKYYLNSQVPIPLWLDDQNARAQQRQMKRFNTPNTANSSYANSSSSNYPNSNANSRLAINEGNDEPLPRIKPITRKQTKASASLQDLYKQNTNSSHSSLSNISNANQYSNYNRGTTRNNSFPSSSSLNTGDSNPKRDIMAARFKEKFRTQGKTNTFSLN
ncbi:uncharacterized protein ASCRUDRAFT_10353 [Ascoidea rubescens DSM 1968]|uniref:Mso1 N-terminal domain-containing protein n=1 Tax=Ascoidea rubescens DSM 1968 TaxID=1344418 RepID=A0A1D2V9V3_9ASCO|nr:hypothetical protein ASCRUDRAFT_10353 [Ascoidea rubescens DSM 1968]ODV58315.1 hypothetical protein ASCRUDRAFT_10353 [Ascoidea rubescens DSM 1968]